MVELFVYFLLMYEQLFEEPFALPVRTDRHSSGNTLTSLVVNIEAKRRYDPAFGNVTRSLWEYLCAT